MAQQLTLQSLCSLAVIAALAACATTTTTPGPTVANAIFPAASAASAPTAGTSVLSQAEFAFAFDLLESAKDKTDNTKAANAFRSGRALIDLRCNEYLDALGSANQAASNERRQVGIVGGFASAIMGLTGSTAKQIAATAATFSFAGSSMDSFTSSFLFSDAAKSVNKLVRDSQAVYLSAVRDQVPSLDYAGAVSILTGYEQTCRPGQIRMLVDQAIAAGTVVAETPGSLPANAQIVVLIGRLMGDLKRPIAEGDAIELFAWFTSDPTERQGIAAKSSLVAALVATPSSPDLLEGKLNPHFLPLTVTGDPIAQRWAPAVARLKANAAGKSFVLPASSIFVNPTLRIRSQ